MEKEQKTQEQKEHIQLAEDLNFICSNENARFVLFKDKNNGGIFAVYNRTNSRGLDFPVLRELNTFIEK